MKKKLKIEIADTPDLQQQGLMFRKNLPNDQGMLFKFRRPQRLSFWGLNTYLPLDIAFIDEDGVIESIERIKPMSMKMVVSQSSRCNRAIETNEGFFKYHGIKPGDKAVIDGHVVEFVQ